MRKSLILAALAAALFAGPGTAAAADGFAASRPDTFASFAALSGVTAEALSTAEMAAVEGQGETLLFRPSLSISSRTGFTTLSLTSRDIITSDSSDLSFTAACPASCPHPKWSETSNPPGRFTGWSAP